ncbi:NlpC/P60 family protein [Actinoplanes sp. NBC_00393]|uniref:NlpC/P60 family protein n=1 Tax=Actinoplanes sp. NBC_00393 TaxID=2975953 RepID=UPI002E20A548
MIGKLLAGIVAVVLGIVLFCAAGPASLLGGGTAVPCNPVSAPASAGSAQLAGYEPEQLEYAATIVAVGSQLGVPFRGQVIAVATALQESGLRNLAGGDRDSIGLFQQRPSQGWGNPQQLLDPQYAATKFYAKLLTINGWHTMPLTAAAQQVQRSAYPEAYAKWEPDATRIVRAVAGGGFATPPPCVDICPSAGDGSGRCADVTAVFDRARSWLTGWSGGPVPYLSSGNPADWFRGYRRDCSGYVSMALGLAGPGLNTSGLAAHSTVIDKMQLRPGDLLINTAPNLRGHVVLFERWSDQSMTSYYGFEQTGGSGTLHHLIPYPYFGTYPMTPYRFAS